MLRISITCLPGASFSSCMGGEMPRLRPSTTISPHGLTANVTRPVGLGSGGGGAGAAAAVSVAPVRAAGACRLDGCRRAWNGGLRVSAGVAGALLSEPAQAGGATRLAGGDAAGAADCAVGGTATPGSSRSANVAATAATITSAAAAPDHGAAAATTACWRGRHHRIVVAWCRSLFVAADADLGREVGNGVVGCSSAGSGAGAGSRTRSSRSGAGRSPSPARPGSGRSGSLASALPTM